MKIKKIIILPVLLIGTMVFFVNCKRSSELSFEGRTSAELSQVCSFIGTWSRCISNGTSSAKITILANKTFFSEKTDSFLTSPACAGTSDGESLIEVSYVLGVSRKSAFVREGTDLDLTSSSNLGCGTEKTVYTVIKFNDSCTEFYSVQMAPGCKSASRGTILDTVPFTKQ